MQVPINNAAVGEYALDNLEAVVEETCRALQRGNILAAHARLYDLVHAVRMLTARGADVPGLRLVLFGWLLEISRVARAAGIHGAPVGPDVAAEMEAATSTKALIDTFARKLTSVLDRSKRPGRRAGSPIVEYIERYIHDHCADGITIHDVAEAMGWKTRRRVRQAWQEGNGDPEGPKRYLDKCRVDAAKPFVVNPSIPMKEIPDRVGFGSYRNFGRVFKEVVGMTPSEYRKEQKKQQQHKKKRKGSAPGNATRSTRKELRGNDSE